MNRDRDTQLPALRRHWDAEAKAWVAYSDDVPGLVIGADVEKLKMVVPELLEENGLLSCLLRE